MTGYLPYDATLARIDELHARAATERRARRDAQPARRVEPVVAESIAIRCATEADRASLQRLATLDSVAARPGEMLIAEVGDEAVAAIHVASGETIADPFRPTVELVELLRLRAERLRDASQAPATRAPRLRALLRSVGRTA